MGRKYLDVSALLYFRSICFYHIVLTASAINCLLGCQQDLASGYAKGFSKLMWEHTGLENKAKDLVVLDFGCGTGLLTEDLRTRVSEVVCIDASSQMIQQLQEKIRSGQWENVRAYCAVLGDPEATARSKEVSTVLEELCGRVDLIASSSVFTFVPAEDLPETMKTLGRLLRPGGLLCHSDWPESDKHPDGFSEKSANELYEMAGLRAKSTNTIIMQMGSEEAPVFLGVAAKP